MTTGPGAGHENETARFPQQQPWHGAASAAGPTLPAAAAGCPPTDGTAGQPGPAGYPRAYGTGWPTGPTGTAVLPGPSGQDGKPGRRRHRLPIIATAVTAFAVAAASTAWAAAARPAAPLSTAAIAARVDPGLVDVTSTLGYRNAVSAGTGIVLTSTGEVLTNNHVIAGATSVQVRDIGNGRSYAATVVGYSESNDIAVLQLRGASGLATAPLGDSSAVRAGAKVVALGNAGGRGGTPAVAAGRVTATGSSIIATDQGDGVSERLTGLIRHTAPIQPGDSGGPLVSTAGLVIGVDTAASAGSPGGTGTTSVTTATTAFAIPVNTAIGIARQIEAGHSSASVHIGATAFLGVATAAAGQLGLPGQSGQGAPVSGALPGTAAAQAGLSSGDVIVSLGGHTIGSQSDLQRVLESYHPGARVTVGWTDQFGQSQTATVALSAGPAG